MVNFVEAQKPVVHWLMRMAGLQQVMVEIEAGTKMNFWIPKEKGKAKKKRKPAVVLIHGFAGEGIMTWQFQVPALTSNYSLYIPDLLFFGDSITDSKDRSPMFQADSVIKALEKLKVDKCSVVGFSYGGMVAFKMAESRADMIQSLIVSGSVIAMTDSISDSCLERLGFSSSSQLLLPESVKGLKALLSVAAYKKLWFPNCIYKDYLQVMFNNRKERAELLEGLVISNKDAQVPILEQRVLLLWGENDNIFNLELAQNMLEQLGEKAALQGIKKAGHLVHIERPCVYNRCLKQFLAFVYQTPSPISTYE